VSASRILLRESSSSVTLLPAFAPIEFVLFIDQPPHGEDIHIIRNLRERSFPIARTHGVWYKSLRRRKPSG
jgi:hypothetical protein